MRILSAVAVLLVVGCTPGAEKQTNLTVFAAVSLKDVLTQLGTDFEVQNPGTKVNFNFAGSNQLAEQILSGAPADVFASADKSSIDKLRIKSDVRVFAENKLLIISRKDLVLKSLDDLGQDKMKIVLAAKEVPAGKYALRFLDNAGSDVKARVLAHVVSYEENVRSVLTKVQLGEADAGIVYKTDLPTDKAVNALEIPEKMNVRATYYVCRITSGDDARKFLTFITAPAAKSALEKRGFLAK